MHYVSRVKHDDDRSGILVWFKSADEVGKPDEQKPSSKRLKPRGTTAGASSDSKDAEMASSASEEEESDSDEEYDKTESSGVLDSGSNRKSESSHDISQAEKL